MPGGSKLLVAIAVVLAVVGLVLGTRRGRGFARARVVPTIRQSLSSIASVAPSPGRLAALFGGSVGVALAYTTALACALAAFDAGTSYAEAGAVYLGGSLIAAARPPPAARGPPSPGAPTAGSWPPRRRARRSSPGPGSRAAASARP